MQFAAEAIKPWSGALNMPGVSTVSLAKLHPRADLRPQASVLPNAQHFSMQSSSGLVSNRAYKPQLDAVIINGHYYGHY